MTDLKNNRMFYKERAKKKKTYLKKKSRLKTLKNRKI